MLKPAPAVLAALLLGLGACAPTQTQTGAATVTTSTAIVLERPASAVTIRAGQTVSVLQTVSADALGIEPEVQGVSAETPLSGLTLTSSGLPLGWSLTLERASLTRTTLLAGSRAPAGQVRLYLRVSAPPRLGRVPRTLAYRLSYKNVDTALALNVTVRP